MSITLIANNASTTITAGAGVTSYLKLGNGTILSQAVEIQHQTPYYVAGTFSKLSITVTINSTTVTATTLRFRKNAADGNQNITIPVATTGYFEDAINTDTIVPNDLINLRIIGGGVGTTVYSHHSVLYNTAGLCIHEPFYTNLTFNVASSTQYLGLEGNGINTARVTDASMQTKIRTAATLKNVNFRCHTNTRTTSTTLRSRINGANGNTVITVLGGVTGTFEDIVNVDNLAVNDLVNYTVTVGTGTGNVQFRAVVGQLETTNNKNHFIAANGVGSSTGNANQTVYLGICGPATGSSVGDFLGTKCNVALTTSFLSAYVEVNAVPNASTVNVWKGALGAGTQMLTIPATTTGFFEDTTNSDIFAVGSFISYKVVIGAGALELLTLSTITTLVDYTVAVAGGSQGQLTLLGVGN